MSRRILVIDDEQGIRAALGQLLEFEGYEVHTLANAADGIAEYQKWHPHLVFLDVKMAGMDGMEALRKLRELDPTATVVMISGHATIRTAVEATQAGAYEILEKPLDTDRILVMLRNALSHLDLQEENARLKQSIDAPFEIVGKTPVMRALMEKIEKVATTPARVLITGDNGTGKELVARAVHSKSERVKGPFFALNCAALPKDILENELFGHEKGAFTGSVNEKPGAFEMADGGTIFLDEIAEMPPDIQVKLLRAIESRTIRRLGGKKEIEVDIRIVAATNRDIQKALAENDLREDLYYRLAVVELFLPPLRERVGDIKLLANEFLLRFAEQNGKPMGGFDDAAWEWILSYNWPGNVRELKNAVERAVIMSRGNKITAADIMPRHLRRGVDPNASMTVPPGATLADTRRQLVLRAFASTNGDYTRTATIVGMTPGDVRSEIASLLNGSDGAGGGASSTANGAHRPVKAAESPVPAPKSAKPVSKGPKAKKR